MVYILMKSLGREKCVYFREQISIVENTFLATRECYFLDMVATYMCFGLRLCLRD